MAAKPGQGIDIAGFERLPNSQSIMAVCNGDLTSIQRWLGKFEQGDKWTFCLTTAEDAETRREHDQTIPPEP